MIVLAILYFIAYVHSYFKLYDLSMGAISEFRTLLMTHGLSLISKHPVPYAEESPDPYQTLKAIVDIRMSILRKATTQRLFMSNLWMAPLVLIHTAIDDTDFSRLYQEELVRGYVEDLSQHDPFLKTLVDHKPDD